MSQNGAVEGIGSVIGTHVNEFMRKLVRRSPWAKSVLLKSISSRRFRIAQADIQLTGDRLARSWQDDVIPQRQRKIVEPDLAAYRAGKPHPAFDAFVDLLSYNIPDLDTKNLLENWMFQRILLGSPAVAKCESFLSGCDYSNSFLRLASEIYPCVHFVLRMPQL